MTRDTRSPAVNMEMLAQHCQHLHLARVGKTLSTLFGQTAEQEPSSSAFLTTVLAAEVAAKQEKHHTMSSRWRLPVSEDARGLPSPRLIRKS